VKLVLAICTYRRPQGLARLLEHLPALRLQDGARPALDVVVVDNHADGEGLAVCRALPASYPYAVHARASDGVGISAARNAACAAALELEPDLIAFLDDDEWPSPQWLAELLRVQREHDADAVGGPTRSVFPDGANPALADVPYYGADMYLADGARCTLQAGGNFLVRASALAALAPAYFHDEFAHSGSEDLAFFIQLAQRGARMHWAPAALVHEDVPPERLTPEWLRLRVVNAANGRVRAAQMLEPGPLPSIVRVTKTVGLLIVARVVGLIARVVPSLAMRADLMRWRGQGKWRAHRGDHTVRSEASSVPAAADTSSDGTPRDATGASAFAATPDPASPGATHGETA